MPEASPLAETARVLSFQGAVLEAVTMAMEKDPSVLVMGVGLDDPLGTRNATGLVEKFGPARVVGTPLSEDAMAGVATGLALAGVRPLQVHGRIDFALLSMNGLVNVAAKVRGMYGGALGGAPIVVRGTIGRSWGQGGQHSQGLQSLFAHIPGLRVVMPSTPKDAFATMAWSLTHSQDPVIFIDHRMLHRLVGPVGDIDAGSGAPDAAEVVEHSGPCEDITIVALSYMNVEARRAADYLHAVHDIRASVIDPLWIRPLGRMSAVIGSVLRSERLLVVDCGWPSFGVSAEIVARVAESAVSTRHVSRLGFAETVCPTAKALEALFYPSAETIAARAFQAVTGKVMPPWKAESPEVAGFRGPF